MPYIKPALVKANDRLRGHGRNSPPTVGASNYAPRHSNLSVRSIAQSVRGMISQRNVDRAGFESRDSVLLRAGEQQHKGPFELADASVGTRSLMAASDWKCGPGGHLHRQASSGSLLSKIEERENEDASQLEVTCRAGDNSSQPEGAMRPANVDQLEIARASPVEVRRRKRALACASGQIFDKTSDHLEVWGNDVDWERWYDEEGRPHLVFDPLRVNPPSEPDEGGAKEEDDNKSKPGRKSKNPFSKLWKSVKKLVSAKSGQQPTAENSHSPVTPATMDTQGLPPALPVRSTLGPRRQHQLRPCRHLVETSSPTVCGTNCLCFSAFTANKDLLEDSFACAVCLELEIDSRKAARMQQLQEQVKTLGYDAVPHLNAEISRLQKALNGEESDEVVQLRKEIGGRFCTAAPLPFSRSPAPSTTTLHDNPESPLLTVDTPSVITTDPFGNDTVGFCGSDDRYCGTNPAPDQYPADQPTSQDLD